MYNYTNTIIIIYMHYSEISMVKCTYTDISDESYLHVLSLFQDGVICDIETITMCLLCMEEYSTYCSNATNTMLSDDRMKISAQFQNLVEDRWFLASVTTQYSHKIGQNSTLSNTSKFLQVCT